MSKNRFSFAATSGSALDFRGHLTEWPGWREVRRLLLRGAGMLRALRLHDGFAEDGGGGGRVGRLHFPFRFANVLAGRHVRLAGMKEGGYEVLKM